MSFQMIRTAAAVALSVASFGVFANDVTGAGASFPAPVYAKWAAAYNTATGVRINYQSVGSGAGIRQIKAKTVDFGASDMPLTDEELAKLERREIQHTLPVGAERRQPGADRRQKEDALSASRGCRRSGRRSPRPPPSPG